MVKIIFSRIGKKKSPFYRIVAMDKSKDPWGDNLEILGNYNPKTKEAVLKIDEINAWIANGAQPSPTVHNLLVEKGVIKEKKVTSSRISKKRNKKLTEKENAKKEKEAAKEEKPTEAPTEATPEVKEEKPAEEAK